jgi:peptidoglycan/xylan/chitin deacetylase (PgdA/CDA1 family)
MIANPSAGASESLLPYERTLTRGVPRAKEWVKAAISFATFPLGSVIRVETEEPAIALTFDDGPHPVETPAVLELLERFAARATFFLVGERAAKQQELVRRMGAAGHAVGNHSWDHSSFRHLPSPARREQLRRTDEALGSAGDSGLFRPPYGEQGLAARLDAMRRDYKVVLWDVVAEDWRDDAAEALLARVLRRLRRGSIVVFHDTLYRTTDERFRDRAPMRAALEKLLWQLSPDYRFVTVPQLLRLGRPVRWPHFHRLPARFHAQLR